MNIVEQLIKKTKYIFHKHDYQILVTSGVHNLFNIHQAYNIGTTEIKCYCSKCGKVFKTYYI